MAGYSYRKKFLPAIEIRNSFLGCRYSKEFAAFLKDIWRPLLWPVDRLRMLFISTPRPLTNNWRMSSWLSQKGPAFACWGEDDLSWKPRAISCNRRDIVIQWWTITIVTNREKQGRDGCLVATVAGTKSEDVINILKKDRREGKICSKGSEYGPFRYNEKDSEALFSEIYFGNRPFLYEETGLWSHKENACKAQLERNTAKQWWKNSIKLKYWMDTGELAPNRKPETSRK